MVRRSRRSPARYLAPVALAAVIAGTYVVVHEGLKKKHSAPPTQAASPTTRGQRKYARVKFYVVQPGDTLTSIARHTGIAVTTLEALNPKIDPNSLQARQRLRLRQ